MRKHNLVGLAGVAAATIILGAGCSPSSNYNGTSTVTPVTNKGVSPAPAASAVNTPSYQPQKLSDQSYAQNAYLISGPNLSADAKQALSGFVMTKKVNADRTVRIDLKAQKAEYRDRSYLLQPGQQLYFVDKFLADDSTQGNNENNIKDDFTVVVDKDGNIIGELTSLSN